MASSDREPSAARAAWSWARACADAMFALPPAILLRRMAPSASRRLAANWAQRALDDFGVQVRVHDRSDGRAARGGCLFVHLNQTSLVESFTHYLAMPGVRWVVNIEFALLPILGWAPWAMGGVAIRRGNRAQSVRALERVQEGLRRGESFGISIEGQRARPGELAPYKKGPAVLAIAAQADILPVVMHGADGVWPRGEWHPRPGSIDIELLPHISTRGMSYEDRDALVAELRRLAEAALSAQNTPGKKRQRTRDAYSR